jgi:hypothetical protein
VSLHPSDPDAFLDLICGLNHSLMLPEGDAHPAPRFQKSFGLRITSPVSMHPLSPEVSAGLWGNEVKRSSMPEAAVNEHRHPCSSEDDVSLLSQFGLRSRIDPEPEDTDG